VILTAHAHYATTVYTQFQSQKTNSHEKAKNRIREFLEENSNFTINQFVINVSTNRTGIVYTNNFSNSNTNVALSSAANNNVFKDDGFEKEISGEE
jgi:hypothetical protein